jgi:hypothetical protein
MAAVPKKRIGEMLLEAGIIDETQLKAALGHQRQWGVRLGQALVDLKLATEADIVRALSLKFGFEVAKLDTLEPYGHAQALKLFPREFAIRNNVFPMWADTANVTVAMSDPTNLAVVDEIRFRTGRRVKVCIGGDHEVAESVKRVYQAEGAVEAIALDLDADSGADGEAVFDPFGGGSKDALEAFFGGGPEGAEAAAATLAAAPPAPAPQAPAPAAPPRSAPPRTATNLPAQAAPAPRPAAPPAAAPQRAPAPTPAARPAQPAAAAPRPTPPAPAPQRPTSTGVPAAPPRPGPAPGAPPPGAARPAAAPAPGRTATALPAQAPAAAAPAPRPTAPAPAPGHPGLAELELEEKTGDHEVVSELTPLDETTGERLLQPVEEEAPPPSRAITPRELAILDSLERLAIGQPAQPDVVKPTQAMAALIRLLFRKGLVSELEFLDELSKK